MALGGDGQGIYRRFLITVTLAANRTEETCKSNRLAISRAGLLISYDLGRVWYEPPDHRASKSERVAGYYPANTRHLPNIGPMLGQRLRRWPSIGPTLGRCLVWQVIVFTNRIYLSGRPDRTPDMGELTCHQGGAALQPATSQKRAPQLHPTEPERSNCSLEKQAATAFLALQLQCMHGQKRAAVYVISKQVVHFGFRQNRSGPALFISVYTTLL